MSDCNSVEFGGEMPRRSFLAALGAVGLTAFSASTPLSLLPEPEKVEAESIQEAFSRLERDMPFLDTFSLSWRPDRCGWEIVARKDISGAVYMLSDLVADELSVSDVERYAEIANEAFMRAARHA